MFITSFTMILHAITTANHIMFEQNSPIYNYDVMYTCTCMYKCEDCPHESSILIHTCMHVHVLVHLHGEKSVRGSQNRCAHACASLKHANEYSVYVASMQSSYILSSYKHSPSPQPPPPTPTPTQPPLQDKP